VLSFGFMSKQTMRRFIVLVGAAMPLLVLGATGAWAFSASFSWCAGSPRFMLQDVPAGTAQLQFAMTDLNKPSFHHGGGTVDYRGQAEVPCGAFAKGFIGSSPPPGEVHTYEFTVKALGANGAAVATTTARRKFPE
jgi:phosphatidylethanolamine-binding protein